MSEVISSFMSLGAESQLSALFMLFLCVIVHTMWSGKSMQLLCILPYNVFIYIRMILVKILLQCVCIVV